MDKEFWLERWHGNQIGFHLNEVNSQLVKHATRLRLEPGDCVFVPLCGKTLDMLWLAEQGYSVIGVELSEVAVQAFFAENGLEARVSDADAFRLYETDAIKLYCGDFFALGPAQTEQVKAVFDRAATVAMPAKMRASYARHWQTITPNAPHVLLITLRYDQSQMDGPPFSVDGDEVSRLYGDRFHIEALEAHDVIERETRFRERGVTEMIETSYALTRRVD